MAHFESECMSKYKIEKFARLCECLIGTEYEINQDDDNSYYIVVFDLETVEEIELVNKINLHVYHGEKQKFTN